MNYIQTLASTLVFLKRILIYKLWLHHALRKNKKRFFTSTVTTSTRTLFEPWKYIVKSSIFKYSKPNYAYSLVILTVTHREMLE